MARPTAAILAGVAVSLGVYVASGRAGVLGLETSVLSGVTVSDVHYRLDELQPSRINAVTFSIRPALSHGSVAVKAARQVYRCTVRPPGTQAVCATTSPPLLVHELTSLTVVAAQ